MLLLQSAAFTDTLVTRLGDQLFSIVLLVVFALYMLRKQKALEDKLDKYMEEDRKEMKDVIQKNTQAFDNLTVRFANKIITLLVLMLCLASCKTIKKQTSEVRHTDSTTVLGIQRTTQDDYNAVFRYSKDTTINVTAKQVTEIIAGNGLDEARTNDGKRIPRSYQTTRNGLTAFLIKDTAGNIRYGCNADSFTIVVNRLIQERIVHNKRYDSLQSLYKQYNADDTATTVTATRSSGWLWAVVVVVAGAGLYKIAKS